MSARILRIEALDLRLAPFSWDFAQRRRAEIDAHFAAAQRIRPQLFNGRVLLLHEHRIDGSLFRGAFFETDFASFMSWRAWGFPDTTAINAFALGALQGDDGAYLLGRMGAHTINDGQVYFPGGTPDPSDVTGDRVDLEGNVRREILEETGLDLSGFDVDPGWYCVLAGPTVSFMKTMRARETAARLRSRILAQLARQTYPELADVVIARDADGITPAMPGFIRDFLHTAFAGGLPRAQSWHEVTR